MTANLNQHQFLQQLEAQSGIEKLCRVVAMLRHPQYGCPWDLKQTHESLRPYMLEEAYEAVEAVPDSVSLKEELGDVLLQVLLHSQLAQDAGEFCFTDVCEGLSEKLIRRHPHVFGDSSTVASPEAVSQQWADIKKQEKQNAGKEALAQGSILDGVSKAQPALSRALEVSRRAVKVGFEWPDFDSLWACVMSEFQEFRDELPASASSSPESQNQERLQEEMGDILFATVNLARTFKIDPEVALTLATQKFIRRFQQMESLAGETALESLDFETWDRLWTQAKQQTQPV